MGSGAPSNGRRGGDRRRGSRGRARRGRRAPPCAAAAAVAVAAAILAVLVIGSAALAVRALVGAPSRTPPWHRAFVIAGNVRVPLRPGSLQRLNLRLTNRTHYTLSITRLWI